jgi:hypothetical protein
MNRNSQGYVLPNVPDIAAVNESNITEIHPQLM